MPTFFGSRWTVSWDKTHRLNEAKGTSCCTKSLRAFWSDRAYVQALHDGGVPDDPRVGPSAPLDWLPDVHHWQLQRLAQKGETAGTTG